MLVEDGTFSERGLAQVPFFVVRFNVLCCFFPKDRVDMLYGQAEVVLTTLYVGAGCPCGNLHFVQVCKSLEGLVLNTESMWLLEARSSPVYLSCNTGAGSIRILAGMRLHRHMYRSKRRDELQRLWDERSSVRASIIWPKPCIYGAALGTFICTHRLNSPRVINARFHYWLSATGQTRQVSSRRWPPASPEESLSAHPPGPGRFAVLFYFFSGKPRKNFCLAVDSVLPHASVPSLASRLTA